MGALATSELGAADASPGPFEAAPSSLMQAAEEATLLPPMTRISAISVFDMIIASTRPTRRPSPS